MRINTLVGEPEEIGDIVVVVDVIRSSTTITTLLDNGCRYVRPFRLTEEARKAKEEAVKWGDTDTLLVGEERGFTPKGFDLNISPACMSEEKVKGKIIFYRSSNLTRILHFCRGAQRIVIGGLINARAVANYLRNLEPEEIGIIACGVNNKLTLEDLVGAGAIAHHLGGDDLSDMTLASLLVYQNPQWKEKVYEGFVSRYLGQIGFEEDAFPCFRENYSDTVPVLIGDKIVRGNKHPKKDLAL